MPKIVKELSPVEVRRLMNKPGLHAVGGVTGLFLQVSPSRTDPNVLRRSWILRATVPSGARRDIGLGSFPTVTLAMARDRGREAHEQIRQGIDPVEDRRKAKTAARVEQARAMTFEECGKAYIAAHEAGWRNPVHRQQWRNTLRDYAYPVVGKLPVAAVDTAMVMRILEPIWYTKTETAGRLRGRIESILAWATVSEFRTGDNPAKWTNHLDQLLPQKGKIAKVRHQPAMPYKDVPGFTAELRANDCLSAKALEFTILTAARTAETIGATRDEIDREAKVWIIPAGRIKAGKEHRVPLCDRALEILDSLPSEDGKLFPLSNMAMLELLRGAGGNGYTVHGFRSSFRDWAAEQTNFPREIAEAALAHTLTDKTESAYQRGDVLQKRARLMTAWSRYCASPPREKGKVIDLQQGRRA
jgi:integrase